MVSLRLKVQLSEDKSNNSYRKTPVIPVKYVYSFNAPLYTTIGELRQLLEKYIVQHYSSKSVQIVRLTTDDGYYLSDDDLCTNVLKDNDRIYLL